jgi:hypothetical protein
VSITEILDGLADLRLASLQDAKLRLQFGVDGALLTLEVDANATLYRIDADYLGIVYALASINDGKIVHAISGAINFVMDEAERDSAKGDA